MFKKICCFCFLAIAIMAIAPGYALADNSDIPNAAKVFATNCAGCHPQGGNIIRRGKTLKAKALKRNHLDSSETINYLVTQGKGNMPAYGDRLTPAEIAAVSDYVLQKAAANWD
jgi:cytochrome c6